LLQLINQENTVPSGSVIGIPQLRLNRLPEEPFPGDGVPNIGGVLPPLPCVLNVNHLRIHRSLPPGVGSVAFTHTVYVVKDANPDNGNDFVPLDAPFADADCPLLHSIRQLRLFPSGSLIGILQLKLNEFPIEPFGGDGTPNTGGSFAFVVNVNHLLTSRPLPAGVGSVAFTQTV
jgi:hypothetical protein